MGVPCSVTSNLNYPGNFKHTRKNEQFKKFREHRAFAAEARWGAGRNGAGFPVNGLS